MNNPESCGVVGVGKEAAMADAVVVVVVVRRRDDSRVLGGFVRMEKTASRRD
jgi:hypothetical protein